MTDYQRIPTSLKIFIFALPVVIVSGIILTIVLLTGDNKEEEEKPIIPKTEKHLSQESGGYVVEKSLGNLDYGLDKPTDLSSKDYIKKLSNALGVKLETKYLYKGSQSYVGYIEIPNALPKTGRMSIHVKDDKILSVEVKGQLTTYDKKDKQPYKDLESIGNKLLKVIKEQPINKKGYSSIANYGEFTGENVVLRYGVTEPSTSNTTDTVTMELVLVSKEQYKDIRGERKIDEK